MKRLVIFDNLIFSLQRGGGISTMWSALIAEVLRSDDIDCLFMEYPGATNNLSRNTINIPVERILVRKHPMPLLTERISSPLPGNYALADGRSLTSVIDGRKVIFHSPYYRTLKGDVRNIVTLHDFIHEKYAISNPLRRRAHSYLKARALRNANAIACVSNATQTALTEYFPSMTAKSHVVNNGIRTPIPEPIPDGLPKHYLLYAGGRESYKGFMPAVEFARMANLPLVVCGKTLTNTEKEATAGTEIIEVTNASVNMVAGYMRSAVALLYTSEYEGFGLPIIEAQTMGCPVVVSSSLNTRDITGPAIILSQVDRETVTQIVSRLCNETERAEIVADGITNANQYTSAKMYADYINLYLSL